jgi:hypothetical protein
MSTRKRSFNLRVPGMRAAGVVAVLAGACGGGSEPAVPTTPTPALTEAPPAAGAAEAGAPTAAADTADAAPSKEARCDALRNEAQSTLDAERIAVDKLCKKDSDCMPIKGSACNFECVNGAIPKSEEKDWNESLKKVKEGACKQWADNNCASVDTSHPPKCVEKKVWCDKGHCALKD